MLDHHGKKMKFATPSMPVEIYGISGVPMAGDEFAVVEGEKTAKQIIENRKSKSRKLIHFKAVIFNKAFSFSTKSKGLYFIKSKYDLIKTN